MQSWRHLRDYRSSIALEHETFMAGCALACPFSSSDELEGAIIAARRAAGRYGRRPWWPMLTGFAIVVGAIVMFSFS
jgi:hypothetical protein